MLRRHAWWLAALAGAAVAGGVVAAVSLGGGSSSSTPTTSQSHLRPAAAALAFQTAITDVVHKLSPSVVQIQSAQGLGSGVVFDSNGDVVTNNHVVAGTGPLAVTAGAHTYDASLVGRFAPDDIAVVRVSGKHLTPAPSRTRARFRSGTSRSPSATRSGSSRASPTASSAPSARASRKGTASPCRS